MAYKTFPDIQTPDYPLEEDYADHTLKMQVDNETILTRPRFTSLPLSFKITWSHLKTVDYNKLRAFYKEMRGGALAFKWTYPEDEGNDYSQKEFIVRFADSSMNFQLVEIDKWSGSITLQVTPEEEQGEEGTE